MTDEPNGNGTTPDPPTPAPPSTPSAESTVPTPASAPAFDVALEEREWDKPWKAPFLRTFAKSLNVSASARVAGCARDTAYEERKVDPEFAAAWQRAKDIAIELREQVADRWAIQGEPRVETRTTVKRGLNEQGQLVVIEETTTTVETVEKDPAMLRWLLTAHRPEVYRPKHDVRHTGADGGPIEHDIRLEVQRQPTRERMLELAALARELEVPPVIEGEGRIVEDDEP